jgi:hypothetical protein
MTPHLQLLPRELASALVKELDDHWLVMREVNIEPMTLAFVKIINDHSYASHTIQQSERDKVLNEVRAKYIEHNDMPCPELAEKYDHLCDAEYCGMCILDFVLEELRSKARMVSRG